MLSLQEKISVRGIESLTDVEILTLLLGSGVNSEAQAAALLKIYNGSLASVAKEDISRLRMVEGIGIKSATILKAASEWGRRSAASSDNDFKVITTSADVLDIFQPYFSSMKHEECWVLYLSASNRVVERYRVSQGGITATVVDCRLIVKRALELLSTQIIMVHNHPSGAVNPSIEDVEMTKKIRSAAALFDIALLDHIIVSTSAYYSFASHGVL